MSSREVYVGFIPVRAIRICTQANWVGNSTRPPNMRSSCGIRFGKAGQEFGIAAVGGGAFESLRIEKGYRFWGSDIHAEYNPYEAGLGFAVRLNKGAFIGREALQKIKAEGITRKLVCLTFDDPHVIVMGKEPILAGDRVLGYVTSANFGYTVGKSIAYGYVPMEFAARDSSQDRFFGDNVRRDRESRPAV